MNEYKCEADFKFSNVLKGYFTTSVENMEQLITGMF